MKINIHSFPNNLILTHREIKGSNIAHFGVYINAGSRDETIATHGLAHYIEHCIFKGTKKRKAFHILNRLDSVGGELNAYTTKEETCYYSSFLTEYLDRAAELLADITFNSTFPVNEIKKEKDVIIDEINSYLDTPSEQIFDDFEELVFSNHSIGRGVLGTVESLEKISRNDILNYTKNNYASNNIVISYVGNSTLEEVKQCVQKYFFERGRVNETPIRTKFNKYKPQVKEVIKPIHQVHCVIGNVAYHSKHKDKNALSLLNNILGGPAMNSRLNLAIREKYGYTYNLESNYTVYSDTGVVSVYLGTDKKYFDKTISLVYKELKKLREQKLGVNQLEAAKKQLIGHIALSQESNLNNMFSQGKSVLLYNKAEDVEQIIKKINAITEHELLAVSNEIFDEKKLSQLTFMPA